MNLRVQNFYNFNVSKLFGTDLHLFELSVWLHAFALALISVFMPIILFRIGLSLPEILLFYALFNIIDVPLNFLARKVIQKHGARAAVILATFAIVAYFIVLYNLANNWTMIIFLAALYAFYDAFYWVGHLYIFSKSAHRNTALRNDVSILASVRILGGLAAPIVGAYILIYSQQRSLIFLATIVMMASLIPLFRMRHLKFIPEEPAKTIGEFLKQPEEKINYWFSALEGLRVEVSEVIWPFFIFFIYGSLKTVAYIPMLISLSSFLLTLVVGKFSTKRNIYKMIAWSALVVAIVWLLRIFFYSHELYALLSVFIIAVMGVLMDVPLDVAIFQRAGETGALSVTTYRNVVHMSGRAVLYLILLFAISFGANIFTISFIIITILMFVEFFGALSAAHKYKFHLLRRVESVE